MTVLVTGGAGFIGTHVLCALAKSGRRCVSIDNYCNSSPKAIERVLRLVPGAVEAFDADIRDTSALRRILAGRGIASVIHLAGLKSVDESIHEPDRYHDNNVLGTQSLVSALQDAPVRDFVFSSSATVYGSARRVPVTESTPLAPQTPYGENKLAIEELLCQRARAEPRWRVANLRYFNPVGAHESGLIGESPRGRPNNLMPIVCRVAAGLLPELLVYGNDYPTPDGTGVRDYIHVMDVAEAHLAALDALWRQTDGAALTLNIGTGRGFSVLELVKTFETVNKVAVARRVTARRSGDVAVSYADPALASRVLGWQAKRGIEAMCRDAWRWQLANPDGYD